MVLVILAAVVALVAQAYWLKKNDYLFRPYAIENIACDHCGGTGVVHDGKNEDILNLCPACFGVGSHRVRRIDAEDKLCPACAGRGRIEDAGTSAWRTCQRCDGRGLVRDAPWISTAQSFTNAAN